LQNNLGKSFSDSWKLTIFFLLFTRWDPGRLGGRAQAVGMMAVVLPVPAALGSDKSLPCLPGLHRTWGREMRGDSTSSISR